MNLELLYPHQQEGFNFKNLQRIPNKANQPSGYYLIAIVASVLKTSSGAGTTLDRYICFTNEDKNQVWIEKLGLIRAKKWFVFEDTRKIEDDEEWNQVLKFLKDRRILE